MRLLFWNTHTKDLSAHIAEIVNSHYPDFIGLAENAAPAQDLITTLSDAGHKYKLIGDNNRIQILQKKNGIKCKTLHIGSTSEENKIIIFHASRIDMTPSIICFVHLRASNDTTEETKEHLVRETIELIESAEYKSGHTNTVIIGDFNLSHFSTGMADLGHFNATWHKDVIIRNKSRKNGKTEQQFFFGQLPTCLSLKSISDDFLPKASYYRTSGNTNDLYWYHYDRAIARACIADHLKQQFLLPVAGSSQLVTRTGIPNVSDHLPLIAEINLEIGGP